MICLVHKYFIRKVERLKSEDLTKLGNIGISEMIGGRAQHPASPLAIKLWHQWPKTTPRLILLDFLTPLIQCSSRSNVFKKSHLKLNTSEN